MRRIGLLAAAAVVILAAASAAAQQSPAHEFCRMTEGPSGPGFEACVSGQIAAAQNVARLLASVRGRPDAASALISVYEECRALWSPDFALIERCVGDRLEGR
jgi:hypothetical protein